jgi:hypothetical protein
MKSQSAAQLAGPDVKVCPFCRTAWKTRAALLQDGDVALAGYQVNFLNLEKGLFLFNRAPCGTTFSVKVEGFRDLYTGAIVRARRTGEKECPGHCLHTGQLGPCPAACECAFVREILQVIQHWPKRHHVITSVQTTEQTAGAGAPTR